MPDKSIDELCAGITEGMRKALHSSQMKVKRNPPPPSTNDPSILGDFFTERKSKYPLPIGARTIGKRLSGLLVNFEFLMFVFFLSAAVLIFALASIRDSDIETQCPRTHNGYPLVSFQVDGNGDEINCQYGVSEVPQ